MINGCLVKKLDYTAGTDDTNLHYNKKFMFVNNFLQIHFYN